MPLQVRVSFAAANLTASELQVYAYAGKFRNVAMRRPYISIEFSLMQQIQVYDQSANSLLAICMTHRYAGNPQKQSYAFDRCYKCSF